MKESSRRFLEKCLCLAERLPEGMDEKKKTSGATTPPAEPEAPPLPPGYHFTISITDVVCSGETIAAMKDELIDIARNMIRTFELRNEAGNYVHTRVRVQRTTGLLAEQETP